MQVGLAKTERHYQKSRTKQHHCARVHFYSGKRYVCIITQCCSQSTEAMEPVALNDRPIVLIKVANLHLSWCCVSREKSSNTSKGSEGFNTFLAMSALRVCVGHMIGSLCCTLSGDWIFLAHFNLMWVPRYKKDTSRLRRCLLGSKALMKGGVIFDMRSKPKNPKRKAALYISEDST